MDAEDKKAKVRSVKPAPFLKQHKRWEGILIVVAVLLVVAVVALSVTRLHRAVFKSTSQKLTDNISHLRTNEPCVKGLPQIEPKANDFIKGTGYSMAAREEGLDYLVKCSIIVGHTDKAFSYADQLDKLYTQDGNTAKKQQLDQSMAYIKSYLSKINQ